MARLIDADHLTNMLKLTQECEKQYSDAWCMLEFAINVLESEKTVEVDHVSHDR